VLAGSGLLTVAGLVLYGLLMRKGPKTARFGGDLPGWLVAATALLSAGWLVTVGYQVILPWIASHSIPNWIKSHWLASTTLADFDD
jgi:hypothetical protein